MNWLEVGCPHCPSVVTFPPAAAGRTVRCLECDKTYLVPTPSADGAPEPAKSSLPPSPPAVEASGPELEPTVTMTQVPSAADDTPPRPAVGEAERPPASPPPPSPPAPPLQPAPALVTSPPVQRVVETVEPQSAIDSPLPEVPILDPPREVVGSKPTPSFKPPAREPTAPIVPSPVPLGPHALGPRDKSDEAQARMHRAELRARVNLAIFVIGMTVMIAFAYFVIYISRRR